MDSEQHCVFDLVELITESGRPPAGTVGTVVDADDYGALVEIFDDRGPGLDFVSVPRDALASVSGGASRAGS